MTEKAIVLVSLIYLVVVGSTTRMITSEVIGFMKPDSDDQLDDMISGTFASSTEGIYSDPKESIIIKDDPSGRYWRVRHEDIKAVYALVEIEEPKEKAGE